LGHAIPATTWEQPGRFLDSGLVGTIRLMKARWSLALAATALTIAGCSAAPPNHSAQVNELTQQVRALPGVVGATNTFGDGHPQGPAYFEIDVDVDNGVTGDQVAAIAAHYLDGLQAVDYTGYRAELDVHHGDNVLLVDTGGRPVNNRDQILAEARAWVALRQQFPGSTVALRAAISHAGDAPGRAVPTSGRLALPDATDFTAVAAAVTTLATSFADLSAGDWTITASKQHPAEIRTSRRLPNPVEMELWNTLNTDQSIAHADVFTVNGAPGPFWVSEKIFADDTAMALRLAEQHLPIVARLPAPVVYTASNQYQGHIGYYGHATAPVMITIGGCTKRKYQPPPGEQALIDRYEHCPPPTPR
jgi:hypothetical protein